MKSNLYIVLGGGLNSDGTLPELVCDRVNWVINRQTCNDIVLFSALYSLNVAPKLSKEGFPLSESHQMAKYFTKKSTKKCQVFLENASFDTIGSAMFVRIHYLERLRYGINKLFLVTSDFHIKRAEKIYRKVLSLAPNPILNDLKPVSIESRINTAARIEREKLSLAVFTEVYSGIHTISESLDWMFLHHNSYNSSFLTGSIKTDELLY